MNNSRVAARYEITISQNLSAAQRATLFSVPSFILLLYPGVSSDGLNSSIARRGATRITPIKTRGTIPNPVRIYLLARIYVFDRAPTVSRIIMTRNEKKEKKTIFMRIRTRTNERERGV